MKRLVKVEVKVRDFMEAELQAQLYNDWGYDVALKARGFEVASIIATKVVEEK